MAAVAFTAYGVHWWALGMSRVFGSDSRTNALMAIPFVVLSGRWCSSARTTTPGLWPIYLTVAAGLNMACGVNVPL